ncbi:MAG: P-II family nitrogen regulator [Rhodospirillales bacterium]|nr:P-II family nitrogen regulator [Alphaproteobacteria bacterium]USO04266.1 MAG: P-II family nitrogen regulator [Rhodospirillales bacterium]
MDFKLIVALVSDDYTEKVVEKARKMGATGATVITSGHGEGLKPNKTFFGLTLEGQIDMVLFTVEQHLSRDILEGIAEEGHFDTESGTGIAVQLNIEDAVGLKTQVETIEQEIEDQI